MPENNRNIFDILARLGQRNNNIDPLFDHREDPYGLRRIIDTNLKDNTNNNKLYTHSNFNIKKINTEQNNIIYPINNIKHLDDTYDRFYRQRDNDQDRGLFDNYINPNINFDPNQIDLNYGVHGGLSQRLGKMFDAFELEGIEVRLVPMSVEEELALFDAHSRFVDRTTEKISNAYLKETGLGLNEEDLERVKLLISLKMQNRKRVSTNDFIAALSSGTVEEEIASLSDKQYFSYDQISNIETAAKDRKAIEFHTKLFQNSDRKYFSIAATGIGKTQKKVEEALHEMGYVIINYELGIATESGKDRYGKQKFKIGRLLKGNEGLLKEFSDDPLRGINGLIVVLSRDPMDIAMMSTNRGWRSCMSNDGLNFRYVYQDIRQGTIVSYLISVTDPFVHDPLARVSLKPFTRTSADFEIASNLANDDVIFRLGPNYGIPNAVFYRALQEFTKIEINANKKGIFSMASGLYGDGMKTKVTRRLAI